MSFDTLSLNSSLVVEGLSLRYRDFDCGFRRKNPRGVRKSTSFVLSSVIAMCIRYPGFFALRALKSFDRIVFLEIALYSMCTILDIVKLKRFKKGTDGFSTLRSNRIFPFTNTIFISVNYLHFPRICQSSGTPFAQVHL